MNEEARRKARAIVARMKPKEPKEPKPETELLSLGRTLYGDRWLDFDYALTVASKCEDDPWKIADALLETNRKGENETHAEGARRYERHKAVETYLMRQFMHRHDLITTRASESTALKQIFGMKPREWGRHYVSYQNITGLRGMHGGAHFDHTFLFRRRNGSYVLATHPYNVTEKCRAEWSEIAARTGAVIEFPDDFPSWWYPGATTLIVCYRQELELQQSA